MTSLTEGGVPAGMGVVETCGGGVKELLEMTDDIKQLGREREREEEQIRYVQMLAVRELQRRKVIESRNWI